MTGGRVRKKSGHCPGPVGWQRDTSTVRTTGWLISNFRFFADFTEKLYTSPKLSLALNYFNELIIENNLYIKEPELDINQIQIEVIGSWLSNENTTSNDKILGMWDFEQVKHELIAGVLGPEITYTWDQMPIKQNVLLQVKINNHIDI